MQPIPENISQFLNKNHVVSIATASADTLWSACCFYVFDAENARLVVLTSKKTQHGSIMNTNPKVAGTIAGQPESITQIKGIQFQATAVCLEEGAERQAAISLFYQAHPVARAFTSDVWALELDNIKFTDNQFIFAQKTLWSREETP